MHNVGSDRIMYRRTMIFIALYLMSLKLDVVGDGTSCISLFTVMPLSSVVEIPMLITNPNPDADANLDWLDVAELIIGMVMGFTTYHTCSPYKTLLTLKDHMA